MKQVYLLSTMRAIGSLLIILLFANCKKEEISTQAVPSGLNSTIERESLAFSGLSQTRTANRLNYYLTTELNYWLQASPHSFAADDNVYAVSKKLSHSQFTIPLLLQDFRFDIPSNATIDNIAITARRFKTGKGSIVDHSVFLVTQINNFPRGFYGVIFVNSTPLTNSETAVVYSQNGAGDNGGLPADTTNDDYQFTPAMINHINFGVEIRHSLAQGSFVVYYDLVEIKVYYSLP